MNQKIYLRPYVVAFLLKTPPRGEPIHGWFHRAARLLHQQNIPQEEVEELIAEAAAAAGRFTPQGEIADAVRRSFPSQLSCA